jgi:hypothetical protein
LIRHGAPILFPILLLACAPKPLALGPPPIPFALREADETQSYLVDQMELPPGPLRPDDAVKTDEAAIALARKECPQFSGPLSASLHNEFWLVRWGKLQWLVILKKDGSPYGCEEVIQDRDPLLQPFN